MASIETKLHEIESRGLWRELSEARGVDFASNDYLGYAEDAVIHAGLVDFLQKQRRVGATGSRLISGNSRQTEETEEFLASCCGHESALIFGSGYLANLGVCVALGGPEAEFFSDQLNHASLIDGIRLAKSKLQIFAHRDLDHLERLLASSAMSNRRGRKVIVTESLFSMDGDFAPLPELIEIAARFDAYLVVDEAHTIGTGGVNNLGVMTRLNYDPARTIVVQACGKALGAYGAFVCGSQPLRHLLVNQARSLLFTTALPPIAVEHIRLAVARLIADTDSTSRLARAVACSQQIFEEYGLRHSGSHLVPLVFGSNEAVLEGADDLRRQGFFVKAIRSPTVAPGSERIRLTIQAHQDHAHYAQIATTLSRMKNESLRHRN